MRYHVRVQGELGQEWGKWFGAAAISREDDGVTLLACDVPDQAALHGLLRRLQDLGLPLVSITRIDPGEAGEPDPSQSVEPRLRDAGGAIHPQALSRLPSQRQAKERKGMNTVSRTSRFLGIAFLLQAITSLASGLILKLGLIVPGSIGESMVNAASRPWLLQMSLLGDTITGAGIVFLGVMLFVVLRKQDEKMAAVGLGLYALEGTVLAASRIAGFAFLRISQEYLAAGRPAVLETMGSVALGCMDFGSTLHMVAFSLGAVLFYWLLYKSRVISRALSLWGLIAVPVVFGATIATLFGCKVPFAVYSPYIPFEFVVGAWILVKGISEKSAQLGGVLSINHVEGRKQR